ncbi:Beta-glucuronidase [Eumeta japonica]|uniref:Beta-glucuronidase n=1 Tax=Eumeta variegata TaxID=151549 RepID=A0A4C1V345_EUMVA|nr:Beta-glucuronidase [Eumeta japonica]
MRELTRSSLISDFITNVRFPAHDRAAVGVPYPSRDFVEPMTSLYTLAWVNGKSVMQHEIGHLPFEVEITEVVDPNVDNLLTVAVDNTLLSDTVPQGSIRDVIVSRSTNGFDSDPFRNLDPDSVFDFDPD